MGTCSPGLFADDIRNLGDEMFGKSNNYSVQKYGANLLGLDLYTNWSLKLFQ